MSAANEHEGHRERVKRKFIENGLDFFEPHEALELYLFYAIPRRDTNALAHRLLDCYGTLSGVCDAPLDELRKDFSLSENAAVFLKLLPQMIRLYEESRLNIDNVLDIEETGEMMAKKFIGRTEEAVSLVLGDAKGKLIYHEIVARGTLSSTGVPARKIVDAALRHNARYAFIAHNHPSGSALPSRADITATRVLTNTLKTVGVTLLDHFIIADGDFVSLRESRDTYKIFD